MEKARERGKQNQTALLLPPVSLQRRTPERQPRDKGGQDRSGCQWDEGSGKWGSR